MALVSSEDQTIQGVNAATVGLQGRLVQRCIIEITNFLFVVGVKQKLTLTNYRIY